MRVARVVAMSVLVAGCSSVTGGTAEHASPSFSVSPATTSSARASSPTTPSGASALPPATGAAMTDVIRWIEAGTAADPAAYRSMTRGGDVTVLDDGVAFTTANAEANCVTDEYQNGALACLLKLSSPPPRPAGIETAWKDNWVDFAGNTVDVGSPHGDPGPFGDGVGAELPVGSALAFEDYRCRADGAGLFCVDYATQTAIKLSAAGVEPFGCLAKVAPPPEIGFRLSC